jgi:hypothetical protein
VTFESKGRKKASFTIIAFIFSCFVVAERRVTSWKLSRMDIENETLGKYLTKTDARQMRDRTKTDARSDKDRCEI